MEPQGGALLDHQIRGLDQRLQQMQQQLREMQQQHQLALQRVQGVQQMLDARLPPAGGIGAPCQAMAIVCAREHNARSSLWQPVVKSAGNAPNPAPTSRT